MDEEWLSLHASAQSWGIFLSLSVCASVLFFFFCLFSCVEVKVSISFDY